MKFRKTNKIPRIKLPNIKNQSISSNHIKFFLKVSNGFKLLDGLDENPIIPLKKQLKNPKHQINTSFIMRQTRKQPTPPTHYHLNHSKHKTRSKSVQNVTPNQIQFIYGSSFKDDRLIIQSLNNLEKKQVVFNYDDESDDQDNASVLKYQLKSNTDNQDKQQSGFNKYELYHKKLLQKTPIYKQRQFRITHKVEWKI